MPASAGFDTFLVPIPVDVSSVVHVQRMDEITGLPGIVFFLGI
jgi:hypothetical protein